MDHLRFRPWICAFVLLLTAACGTSGPEAGGGADDGEASPAADGEAPGTAVEASSVRIAMGAPEMDTLTVAKWVELLNEAGVEVRDVEFASGANAFRAMAAGEADVTLSPPVGILQWIQQRPGGLEVLAAQILKPDYVLMVSPEISSVEDLVGKQIGISVPGDISHALTAVALEESGVDPSSVEFVQIGGTSARIAALTSGQIQAGAAHVTDGLAAALESDIKPILNYWEVIPTYAFHFLQARSDWLEEHPDLAQLLVDTLLEANRWAQENEEEFIELSREYVPDIPDELRAEVYRLFRDNDFFAPNGGLDSVDATVAVEQQMGTLGELPDSSEWVNPSYVEDYLDREGRW